MSDEAADCHGLACDRGRVVVELRSYRFPDRCVMTNEVVSKEHVPVRLTTWRISPFEAAGSDDESKNATKGSWAVGLLQVTNVHLRLPLSHPLAGRSAWPGYALVVSGMVTAIAGSILVIVGIFAWNWPGLSLVVPPTLGYAIFVGGVHYLRQRYAPLSVHRVASGFVWLNGVSPGLLAELPPWTGSVQERSYLKRTLLLQFSMVGLCAAIGVAWTVYDYAALADALGSRRWLVEKGAIVSSSIVSRTDDRGRGASKTTQYEPQAEYEFSVQGVTYSGERLHFGNPQSSLSRQFAEQQLQRQYPIGRAVTVYYHPRNPQRSSLARATAGQILSKSLPPALTLALATASLIAAGLNTRRYLRATEARKGTRLID